jgi:hypothetical protein
MCVDFSWGTNLMKKKKLKVPLIFQEKHVIFNASQGLPAPYVSICRVKLSVPFTPRNIILEN